jgi:hypothetical protein
MTVIAQKPGDVEEMWISEIEFDGKTVSGVLLNAPNGLRSIRKGDRAQVQVSTISDWMYAIGGRALGAFTVNQLRQAMSADERADHDGAWGFDFGDPRAPQLVPDSYPEPPAEHPMSVNMSKSLEAELTKSRALLTTPDERGFTLLHELALAGSSSGVTIALAHGADREARTKHGMTALDLAQAMKWATVIELLTGSRSSR